MALNLIETLVVVLKFSFGVGQFIAPRQENLDFSHLFIENLRLLAFVILGYLLIAVVTTMQPKLIHANCNSRLKSLRLILTRAMLLNQSRLSSVHLRLMFLFFSLFLFFNLNFLAGSITTEKVVVLTNEIVDSPSKLIATSKTVAFGDGESDLVKRAPEGSFLHRLSRKKVLVLDSSKDFIRMKTEINNHVLFTSTLLVVYLTNLLSKRAKEIGSVAFIESTDYYELLGVFQMRRSLSEESKRFINSR